MTIKTRLDVREVYMTVTKENIKDFTEKYAQICRKNDTVEKELFTEYGVKRGLRDLNGKGVLTGITNISRVESSKIVRSEECALRRTTLFQRL